MKEKKVTANLKKKKKDHTLTCDLLEVLFAL